MGSNHIEIIELSDSDDEKSSNHAINVKMGNSYKSKAITLNSFDIPTSSKNLPPSTSNVKSQSDNDSDSEGPNFMNTDAADEVIPKMCMKKTNEEVENAKFKKQLDKVSREISTSRNSKCEQFLFCNIDPSICRLDGTMKQEIQNLFEERKLSQQLSFDFIKGDEMVVRWQKKRVNAYIEENKLFRDDYMEKQDVFGFVIDGTSFTDLTMAGLLEETLANKMSTNDNYTPRLVLMVYGKHSLNEEQLTSSVLELYERFQIQMKFVDTPRDFSFLIVQLHRSLAKFEKKFAKRSFDGLPQLTKGIDGGTNLINDWWSRMLEGVYRISENQRRAIIRKYPNPFELMKLLLALSPGDAMFEIAHIEMECGRRVGPIFAQRLYKILTSTDGQEVIDNGS